MEDGASLECHPQPRTRFCNVIMIPSKLSMFARSGMLGTFVYFTNILLREVGLSVEETGLISGIACIVSAVTSPIWGFLIDYTGRRKTIFVILTVGTSLSVVSLPFVARIINPIHYNTTTNTTANDATPLIPNQDSPYTSKIFFAMLTVLITEKFFTGPLGGMLEAAIMNVISTQAPAATFGMQRVYGGLSYGLMAFLSGIAIDHCAPFFTAHHLSKYTAAFCLYIPMAIITLIVCLILLNQMQLVVTNTNGRGGSSQIKLVFSTCRKPKNFLFILTCFMVGLSNMTLVAYLYMLMKDQMKSSKSLMGLSSLIQSIAQLLIYPLADRIIKIVRGPVNAMAISLFSYFIRFLLNSYFTNPVLAVISQSLHGTCFSLFWVAAVMHTQKITPKPIYVTMFTLINSAYYNVGGIVANTMGGMVYGRFGGQKLFRGMSVLCLAWAILLLFFFHIEAIVEFFSGKRNDTGVHPESDT